MPSFFSRIRRPVKRERAEHYLLLMLVSFAAAVLLTRAFLALTGYPQLGNSTLHIAHVLWGGLLLFIAAILPLMLANREVYTLGGLLTGIGVGLFIDEVGKFITQTNDYFFPAAAPIIYVFFLLTVLLYLQVRRPPSRDARAELYRALDALGEVLDHDLEPHERHRLEERLRSIVQQREQPELARLARALLDFLAADTLAVVDGDPRFVQRWRQRWQRFEGRWVRRVQLKVTLILGLLLFSLPALLTLLLLVLAFVGPLALQMESLMTLVEASDASANLISLGLAAIAGLPMLLAALLLALGRDRPGVTLGYGGLLFSLTIGTVVVVYIEQFAAFVGISAQFVLLLTTLYYRRRYLAGR